MNLILNVKLNNYNNFFKFLKDIIKSAILKNLDVKKLIVFDEYFKNNLNIKVTPIARQVIIIGIENLIYSKTSEGINIYINPSTIVYNTQYHVAELCRLINYGTLDLKGYPIFTNTFNKIKDNINMILSLYLETVGK